MNETTSQSPDALVTIQADLFRRLLVAALKQKNMFDEEFYIETNIDVREAVESKLIASAAEHYYTTGYFENRLPRSVLVDERYYLAQNPDVADAVRSGKIKDAQEHFNRGGFREGRLPYKDFSLF